MTLTSSGRQFFRAIDAAEQDLAPVAFIFKQFFFHLALVNLKGLFLLTAIVSYVVWRRLFPV